MPIPFACDLAAIPAAERGAHQQVTRRLISSATVRESGEGFVLEVPAHEHVTVTEFVGRERLCCPFLEFVVAAALERRTVELHIGGPAGAKEFIRAELHLPG